jgi:hypothetical protein
MVDLARFQRTVVDETGAVIASPTIEVREQVTNALVSLYSDRDGASAISNPFTGTSGGLAAFHVAGGAYKITATSGAFTAEWTWVGVGTASEYDFTDIQDYIDNAVEDAGLGIVIDNVGLAITTGVKGDLVIPFNCDIVEWTLLADQSGSIVFDIWKDTYANFPPTVGDSITASAKPTISSSTKGQSSTLTGWTVSCLAGDILRLNVDSASTIQRVTLFLKLART